MLTIKNWSYKNIKAELEGLTKKQKLEVAIFSAESVLHVFEDKHPDDDRPRLAIEAVKNHMNNPSAENEKLAADAADAAYYASADAASYAAACVADCVAYAVDCVAYAVDCVADATTYAGVTTYAAAAVATTVAVYTAESVKKKIIDYINKLKKGGDRAIEQDAKNSAHFVDGDSYSDLCEGMKNMEYPYIGEFSDIWCGGIFKNITREYLDDTYGEVESQEHAEFIIKLTEGCGFNYVEGESIKDARSFVFYSGDMLIFYRLTDCDLAKNKKSRKIDLPLPPKEEDMKSENMKSEEWPKVGDEVVVASKRGVVTMGADSRGVYVVNVDDEHCLPRRGEMLKPPTPEEDLAAVIANAADSDDVNEVHCMIAKAIINGEIEGLEYKP